MFLSIILSFCYPINAKICQRLSKKQIGLCQKKQSPKCQRINTVKSPELRNGFFRSGVFCRLRLSVIPKNGGQK
jgi:hypothetical protein